MLVFTLGLTICHGLYISEFCTVHVFFALNLIKLELSFISIAWHCSRWQTADRVLHHREHMQGQVQQGTVPVL